MRLGTRLVGSIGSAARYRFDIGSAARIQPLRPSYSQPLQDARVSVHNRVVPVPRQPQTGSADDGVTDTEVEAVQAACRVLVAISAQSIAAVDDVVDLAQWRALVVIASRGSVSLGELASATSLHLSTTSRMCDRLVDRGLLHRADDPADRRQLTLTLTGEGRRLVHEVIHRRKLRLTPLLARLSATSRAQLMTSLRDLAEVAGEPADSDLWFMGWPTGSWDDSPDRNTPEPAGPAKPM
jgi:DNA-binding MarR family transcriptional regulator